MLWLTGSNLTLIDFSLFILNDEFFIISTLEMASAPTSVSLLWLRLSDIRFLLQVVTVDSAKQIPDAPLSVTSLWRSDKFTILWRKIWNLFSTSVLLSINFMW